MLLLSFFQLILNTGCTTITAQEQLVTQCSPIINDIMLIQSERDLRMEAMQQASKAHKNDEISTQAHTRLFEDWHQAEAQLRSAVNTLYIQAETDGCL